MILSRKRRKPQFAFGQTVSFGFMDSTLLPQFADSFDHFFQGFRIFLTLTTITLHIPIRGWRANLAVIMAFDLAAFVRQPLTSSRKELDDALSMVDTPTRKELEAGIGDGTSLYDAIVTTDNPKAQTFFSQWKILFGEVCGYDVDNPSDKIKKLADFYQVGVKNLKPAELLLCLKTAERILEKANCQTTSYTDD